MRKLCFGMVVGIGLATVLMVLATPQPAHAFIHEIIAAICRAPAGDVEPPGQSNPESKAFVRALMATGFIVSIEQIGTQTVFTLDPTVPNSKFRSVGHDVVFGNITLSPGVEVDPNFAAHLHCPNF